MEIKENFFLFYFYIYFAYKFLNDKLSEELFQTHKDLNSKYLIANLNNSNN